MDSSVTILFSEKMVVEMENAPFRGGFHFILVLTLVTGHNKHAYEYSHSRQHTVPVAKQKIHIGLLS
jgi:hypothetical protein